MFKNKFRKKTNTWQAPAGTAESKKRHFPKQINVRSSREGNNKSIDFSNDDFFMIKGRQLFAIYFPNVDILMIKGKHFFTIFQVSASILGFYLFGFITLSLNEGHAGANLLPLSH